MTVLIVDNAPFGRESLAEVLRLHGHEPLGAADAAEALAALRRRAPDMILLELALPDMSGVRLLKVLRRNPGWREIPVIVLTEHATRSDVLAIRELKVHSILLKSRFKIGLLLDTIRGAAGAGRAAEPSEAPELAAVGAGVAAVARGAAASSDGHGQFDPDFDRSPDPSAPPSPSPSPRQFSPRAATVKRLKSISGLKSLRGAVAEVLAIASSADGSRESLAAALSCDPILSSKVLRVANSACYARAKGHVTDVAQAIAGIGFAEVRNIASAAAVIDAIPSHTSFGLEPVRCWQHSLAVAMLMGQLHTPDGTRANAGTAHLIGLCHDLTEILLLQYFAAECENAARRAAQSGRTRDRELAELLGLERSELTTHVFDMLAVLPEIAAPILEFLAHGENAGSDGLGPDARNLSIANTFAHALLLATRDDARIAPFGRAAADAAVDSFDRTPQKIAEFRSQVAISVSLLAQLSAADEARALEPLIPAAANRLWYVRDPAFGAADPIELALSLMARNETHPRLPEGHAQFSRIDGIVVLAADDSACAAAAECARRAGEELDRPAPPVLCLTPAGAAVTASAGAQVRALPVSLRELADFIAAC